MQRWEPQQFYRRYYILEHSQVSGKKGNPESQLSNPTLQKQRITLWKTLLDLCPSHGLREVTTFFSSRDGNKLGLNNSRKIFERGKNVLRGRQIWRLRSYEERRHRTPTPQRHPGSQKRWLSRETFSESDREVHFGSDSWRKCGQNCHWAKASKDCRKYGSTHHFKNECPFSNWRENMWRWSHNCLIMKWP